MTRSKTGGRPNRANAPGPPSSGDLVSRPTSKIPSAGARLWAAFLELLVRVPFVAIYYFVVFRYFIEVDPDAAEQTEIVLMSGPIAQGLLTTFVITAVMAAYETVCLRYWGGSIGKRKTGLLVQMADGTPVTWKAAAIRAFLSNYVVRAVPVIGPAVAMLMFWVSMVWLFKDHDRRTVWDRVAGTIVTND